MKVSKSLTFSELIGKTIKDIGGPVDFPILYFTDSSVYQISGDYDGGAVLERIDQ